METYNLKIDSAKRVGNNLQSHYAEFEFSNIGDMFTAVRFCFDSGYSVLEVSKRIHPDIDEDNQCLETEL